MVTQFITDSDGNRTDVIISIKDYEHFLEIEREFMAQVENEKNYEKELLKRMEELESGFVSSVSME